MNELMNSILAHMFACDPEPMTITDLRASVDPQSVHPFGQAVACLYVTGMIWTMNMGQEASSRVWFITDKAKKHIRSLIATAMLANMGEDLGDVTDNALSEPAQVCPSGTSLINPLTIHVRNFAHAVQVGRPIMAVLLSEDTRRFIPDDSYTKGVN